MKLYQNASKYHIFGDSNVNTIAHAVLQMNLNSRQPEFPLGIVQAVGAANEFYVPFYESSSSQLRFQNSKIISGLEGKLCDPDGLMYRPDGALIFMSAGFHTLIFLASARWDDHRHWRITSNPELQPVSDGAFAEMVVDLNRYLLQFLRDTKELGYRFAVLSSPPPTKRFIKALERKKWTQDDILFMDKSVREVMISHLGKLEIPFISPPDGVIEDGFLKSEFLKPNIDDTHHGNVQYSKKFLQKIAENCGYSL